MWRATIFFLIALKKCSSDSPVMTWMDLLIICIGQTNKSLSKLSVNCALNTPLSFQFADVCF